MPLLFTEVTDFCNGSLYIFCNIFSLIEVCKRFIACLKKTLFTPFCDFYLLTFADKEGSRKFAMGARLANLATTLPPVSLFKRKNKSFINFSILELKSFVSIKGYDYQLYRILKHFMVIITFQFW